MLPGEGAVGMLIPECPVFCPRLLPHSKTYKLSWAAFPPLPHSAKDVVLTA